MFFWTDHATAAEVREDDALFATQHQLGDQLRRCEHDLYRTTLGLPGEWSHRPELPFGALRLTPPQYRQLQAQAWEARLALLRGCEAIFTLRHLGVPEWVATRRRALVDAGPEGERPAWGTPILAL